MRWPLRAAAAALFVAALAAGCRAGVGSGAVAVALDPSGERQGVGELVFCGGVSIGGDVHGLSALDVAADGREAVALSDMSYAVRLALGYDAEGCLTDARVLDRIPLKDTNGRALGGRSGDTEALAPLADGGYAVSLERRNRILRYDDAFARAVEEPVAPGWRRLSGNKGVEGLTQLRDGRLMALAEGGERGGAHPAWIGRGDRWVARAYRPAPGFRPVGLATLPDGGVLVLERRFTPLEGFSSRIAHLDEAALMAGGELEGRELARLAPPLNVDNFEGIAVLPGDGAVRIFLMSDDNRFLLQRTLLMQFLWRR